EISTDKLIYHEKDEAFNVGIQKSKSRRYIFIASGSTLSDEYRILKANHPEEKFRLFQKRIYRLEYSIEHFEEEFYILTNKNDATNFKLMKTPIEQTEMENWQEVIPHRKNVLLENVDIFKDFMVLTERTTGLNKFRIISWDGKSDYYLPFESQTYTAFTVHNPEFDTPFVRYVYNGLKSPTKVIDYNVKTEEHIVRK